MKSHDDAPKLACFSTGPDDAKRLADVGKAVASAALAAFDALYERIARTPETSGLFSSQSTMAAARKKQIAHWSALFAHGADAPYFDRAEKIGTVG
jgi:methyl-accepting chemotaxis protein